MSADILVFPLSRRTGYIRDKAQKMINRPTSNMAARYLDDVIGCSWSSLLRFDLPADVVEGELKSLRTAIQAEVWRLVMETGAERA